MLQRNSFGMCRRGVLRGSPTHGKGAWSPASMSAAWECKTMRSFNCSPNSWRRHFQHFVSDCCNFETRHRFLMKHILSSCVWDNGDFVNRDQFHGAFHRPGRKRTRVIFITVVLFIWVLATHSSAQTPIRDNFPHESQRTKVRRIVAIGDVHGDPEKFQRILLGTGVARRSTRDDANEDSVELFRGPRSDGSSYQTTLIQMGDLVDRGHDDRRTMNMAFDLHEQARVADDNGPTSNVVLLLGNHELMNLQKQYHYVHSDRFGGFLSKGMRDAAFDSSGPYGRFIVEHFKTIHIAERTLFVHAGLTSDLVSGFVDEDDFNDRARADLRSNNYRSPLLNSRGPVWTRQTVFEAKRGECGDLEKTLVTLGVDRMVVGHTPERDGHVGEYCDGKLFTVDVGLSRWMYDGFAALEILVTEEPGQTEGESKKQVTLWELSKSTRILLWPRKKRGDEEGIDLEDL